MTRFFLWMQRDEGWKTVLAAVYAIICVFDFVIVPSWIGVTRSNVLVGFEMMKLTTLEVPVQLEIIKSMTFQHQPFTLQGGGLFHLAFGALLTGSAITKFTRGDKNGVESVQEKKLG